MHKYKMDSMTEKVYRSYFRAISLSDRLTEDSENCE